MFSLSCTGALPKVSLFYEFTKNNIPLQNDFLNNTNKYI